MLRDQADPPPPVLGLQREVAAVEFPGGVGAEPGDGAGRPLRRDVLGEVHPAHRVDAEALMARCMSVATVPGLRPTTWIPLSRYSLSTQRVSISTAALVAQ